MVMVMIMMMMVIGIPEAICDEANRVLSIDLTEYATVAHTVRTKRTHDVMEGAGGSEGGSKTAVAAGAGSGGGLRPTWTPYPANDLAWVGGSLFGAIKVHYSPHCSLTHTQSHI